MHSFYINYLYVNYQIKKFHQNIILQSMWNLQGYLKVTDEINNLIIRKVWILER